MVASFFERSKARAMPVLALNSVTGALAKDRLSPWAPPPRSSIGLVVAFHLKCVRTSFRLTKTFYPRKGKITVYLMDGTVRYAELLAKLGRHTATGYCVYIRRLSDVDLPILEQIVQESYEHIKSQDGHIHQILWQTAQQ